MSAPSRTAQFNKLHKILKKHYKPVAPDSERTVLEQLLFASCAENAHYAAAEEAYAALVHNFFDLNEIRVSTVRELAETMAGLPDPAAAAQHVKRVLQSVFEATYDFSLEDFRKLNLGPAAERLAKYQGTTNYTVAYVVQAALGGHAIPVDAGTLRALYTVQLVTEEDLKAGVVSGLERAIAKSKGIEFGSLLHQLGADFAANPYAPALKAILTEIDPDAATRLPKRRTRREGETRVQRRRRRAAVRRARLAKEAEQQEPKAKGVEPPREAKKRGGRRASPAKTQDAADKAHPPKPKQKPPSAKKSSAKKKDSAAPNAEAAAEKKSAQSGGLSKRKPR